MGEWSSYENHLGGERGKVFFSYCWHYTRYFSWRSAIHCFLVHIEWRSEGVLFVLCAYWHLCWRKRMWNVHQYSSEERYWHHEWQGTRLMIKQGICVVNTRACIKSINNAVFVTCASHSLNLVGQNSMDYSLYALKLFKLLLCFLFRIYPQGNIDHWTSKLITVNQRSPWKTCHKQDCHAEKMPYKLLSSVATTFWKLSQRLLMIPKKK